MRWLGVTFCKWLQSIPELLSPEAEVCGPSVLSCLSDKAPDEGGGAGLHGHAEGLPAGLFAGKNRATSLLGAWGEGDGSCRVMHTSAWERRGCGQRW